MVYIRWYTKYSHKKQVELGDDGEITASSVNDRPYSGGAYTAYPGTDVSGVIKIIDDVADDGAQKLYEIIYNHILNSSRKKDKAYIDIAVHCAKKMNLSREKLYEDFQTRYPVKIDYKKIDADAKIYENFRTRLEFFGIRERRDKDYFPVCCDSSGEVVIVKKPDEQNKYGSWEYMKLPVVELAVNKEMHKRDLHGIPYDLEAMRDYSKRCQRLEKELQEQGIHRDIRRHMYCDKEGREVKIELPCYEDKNDFGRFSYVEKNPVEKQRDDEYR